MMGTGADGFRNGEAKASTGSPNGSGRRTLKDATVRCQKIVVLQNALQQAYPSLELGERCATRARLACRISSATAEPVSPQGRGHVLCRLGQHPDVRCIDVTSHDGRGLGLVVHQAGIVDPSLDLPEPVEMEKDQGVLIHQYAVAVCPNRVISQVPGGEVGALVLQHGDALKAAGPVIEIFLICEAAVLVPIVTPLQAALAPPV